MQFGETTYWGKQTLFNKLVECKRISDYIEYNEKLVGKVRSEYIV